MSNKLLITIIFTITIGCQKPELIEFKTILGNFHQIENSEDYNHLELRNDNTYHFSQAKFYSCDVWGHWYGEWELNENEIILYEGINLDSIVEIEIEENIESDTLIINFAEDFLKEFPELRVKIGLDLLDTEIVNKKIILDKREYCIKNEIFESNHEIIDSYKYYPLELNLRSNNYFQISHYILNNGRMHFGLGSFERGNLKKKKLIKYKKYKGNLISNSSKEWINNHKLNKII